MPCHTFASGIVCSRGRKPRLCQEPGCTTIHEKLCDWPLHGGKTCDRRLCAAHARNVGPDRDYCPTHHALAEAARKAGEARMREDRP